jgi:hypothetical protein
VDKVRFQNSGFKLNLCIGVILFGSLLVAVVLLPQRRAVARVSTQQARVRPTPRPTPPPSAQAMFAPLAGIVSPAGAAEIAINNNGPEIRIVSPVFYDLEGAAHAADAITLIPLEVRHIDLESLLPPTLKNVRRVGGLSLNYNGGMMEVVAQITVLGNGNGSVDIPFSATMDFRAATQEAVWWTPRNSVTAIVLGNATDEPLTASLAFSSGETQSVELAPHASRLMEKRSTGNQGASPDSVQVTSSGPAGSLRATGFVRAAGSKFTSAIHFYDRQHARQPHLFASNFRVRGMESHLVLRNSGETAITATPKFFPSSGDNPVELPAVNIAPRQNVEVNLAPLMTAAASRDELEQVSVRVTSSGDAGSLIGALVSSDNARRMNWSVPLRDSGPTRNSTGGYPWKLSGDYKTLVSITNVSDRPAKYVACLNFTGGTYQPQTEELAVGETVYFDLRKLRDEQIPDKDGRVIPLTVESGQFHWSKVGGGRETDLIGRTEVTSVSGHVSSSFSCPVCCPDSGPYGYLTPNALTLYVDGFLATSAQGDYINCYGWISYTNPIGLSNLGVSDPACISFTYQSGYRVTGLGVGTAQFFGEYSYDQWYDDGMDCYVYYGNGPADGDADVKPVIRISKDGTDITDVNTAVIIGQKISLSVSIDANGAQATNYSWTIPAKAIKQYTASPSSYQTGAVQNLQANDLNQTTVAFYWLDGAFSGGQSKKVTFSCKVNNKTYSAEANFTVFRPKSDITTVVNPDNVPAGTELINIYTPGPIFGFGKGNLAPPRGIEFTSANFEMPAGFTGLSHNLSWLQKISGTTINRQANDGKWKDCTGNGLDSEFTYQNANAKTTPADDAPAVELFSSEKRVIVSDNFEM